MKKNGFTLVELLAVVTILSVLLLLVVPKIVNQLNNSKDEVNDVTKKLIYTATEKFIKDFNIEVEDYEIKCISVSELQDEEYLSDTITNNNSGVDLKENKVVKVENKDNNGNQYELVDKKTCNEEQGMLTQGLTPVAYDGNNWYVVSSSNKNNEWYDYDNQKWANAVVLSKEARENHKDKIGSIVTVEGENPDVLMMYVWIPRYEYKIEGDYGTHTDGTEGTQELPGEIKVNFIGKNTTTATEGYHIHPVFTFGDKEENGFWVGKFELSHTEKSQGSAISDSGANLNCTIDSCTETPNLRILPNVPSLRYNNVSNFFYAIKGISTSFGLSNIDTHMMKNSEWGAVAYLSQSKYGKYGNTDYEDRYKEVYQNMSSEFITGSSNGTPSQSGTRSGGQCAYNDMQDLGKDTNNYKMGQCGLGASTTGNIYGVYDMSGGAQEYVMGVYAENGYPKIENSGFSTDPNVFTTGIIDLKYYDIYTNATNQVVNDATESCGGGVCYGHGLSETSEWYGDEAAMVTGGVPWFVRGGHNTYLINSGVFCFDSRTSYISCIYSARVVAFAK